MRAFRSALRGIDRQDFISELLVRQLGVQFLAVGDDFRFGAGRRGDFLLLQKAGVEYGFDVTSTQTFCEGGVRISSTAVRQALADDDLPWRRRCWGIRLLSPAALCTVMNSGAQ